MKAENLPFADDEFDVATAIEVLEHVPDPAHTVAEMARVAQRWLLVSVPREPLWRGLNVARGAYIKDLGNTPGHVNHWSKRAFVALLEPPRRGRRGALAVPVDDAARPALTGSAGSGYGRGARILSIGIALTGVVTFAYFSVASYVLDDVEYKQIALLWSVLFVTVSVIYRPIEQLLSRTIADRRARGFEHDHPLRTPLLIQGGFALALPRHRARRCAGRSRTTCSTARRRCTGSSSSPCSPTRRATSRAAGWPGTSGSASTAGSCSWRRARGWRSRSPSRSASPTGRPRWRSGWRRRRSSR